MSIVINDLLDKHSRRFSRARLTATRSEAWGPLYDAVAAIPNWTERQVRVAVNGGPADPVAAEFEALLARIP